MLSKPLLATLLAAATLGLATQASAFSDLDCIGTEFCTEDTGCAPSVTVFGVAFDWPASAVDVATQDRDIRLRLAAPDVDPDGTQGNLTYFNTDNEGLVIEFQGPDIAMTLILDDGAHRATCTAREAA